MKYLHLIWHFFKNTLLRELEFRTHFLITTLESTGWIIFSLLMVKIVYVYTDNLAGYSEVEALLIYGIFRLITAIFSFTAQYNLQNLPELIRTGELDFYLLRPVPAQFLISFRYFSLSNIVGIFTGLVLLIYALSNLSTDLSPFRLLFFILLIISGLVILYSLYLMLVTLSFWITKLTALRQLYDIIRNPGRFPIDIYKGFFHVLLMYIIPIGIIFTLPGKFLIKTNNILDVVLSIFFAILFFVISRLFWSISIKRYSSASSWLWKNIGWLLLIRGMRLWHIDLTL